MTALEKKWTEVKVCPENQEIVSGKQMFKIKESLNGEKLQKARLMARGFKQTN